MKGLLEKYCDMMPYEMQIVIGRGDSVTLGEGDTRLWRAKGLEEYLNGTRRDFSARIYLKLEGDNRGTNSFKDRGMTAAVTMAKAEGKKTGICASTGNTLASAAAYCQTAGMKLIGLLPSGKVAPGKIFQAALHGAEVLQIKGNFDDGMRIVKKVAKENREIILLNSVNPYRMEGQKTAAFEVVDFLGHSPRFHFLPVGNAGNISAYWQGYKEYFIKRPLARLLPHMMGVQAEFSAPVYFDHVIENPETVASAIRIGNPAKWDTAREALKESEGQIDIVSDAEIMKAYELLPKLEPVSCEPSSAAALAGLLRAVRESRKQKFMKYMWHDCDIVVTLTGSVFKDLSTAEKTFVREPREVEATFEGVMKAIGG